MYMRWKREGKGLFVYQMVDGYRHVAVGVLAFWMLLAVIFTSWSASAGGTSRVSAVDVWYVAPWGKDTNDCRSWATACRTIRGAYEKFDATGTIRLASGVYRETNVLGGTVTLIGAGPNRTIVDGGGMGTVFTVFEGAHVKIASLTIRNGRGQDLDRGGAITNWGTLLLDYVVIEQNRSEWGAVGGIGSTGVLTITNSVIADNTGPGSTGGILSTYSLYMENVTVAGNRAPESGSAGGIKVPAGGTATLVNVTISGNASFFGAGGISTYGVLSLKSVTLADNVITSPADIPVDIYNGGRLTLVNTLIAGECRGEGTVISQGYNLARGDTCQLTHATDQQNTDPKLQPLAYNGGLGKTHALQPGSPAIDRGNDAACPAADQRGMPRWDGDGDGKVTCDIGAFERVTEPFPRRGFLSLLMSE